METALSSFANRPHPLTLSSLHLHRPLISRPISPLSFKIPNSLIPKHQNPNSSLSLTLKASSFSSLSSPNTSNPKPHNLKSPILQTLNPNFSPFLGKTLIAAVAVTAIFFAKFNVKPLIAAPIPPAATVEESISDEDKEKNLEEYLTSHSDDVQALRDLMELKIKAKKVQEAVQIIDRLIELEPEDSEWPLLKSHMFCYSGDTESAKNGFNEILSKEPLRVEAYHGLVMAASQGESSSDLEEVEKRIREGIELVKKENKKEELRDFMLLLAQVRVIEGDYSDALNIYQELVKDEPRDFRPYLCQGIIYTLLKKKDEAEKSFEKYRRLVPEGHPYARYFDDNMNATKLFTQKVENERARAAS